MHLHRFTCDEGKWAFRGFFHLYDHQDGTELLNGSCEAYVGRRANHQGIGVGIGDQLHNVKLHVGVWRVFNLYLKLGSQRIYPWTNKRKIRFDEREVAVRVHDRAIWWSIWRDPMGGWSRDTPKWRDGNWHFWDTLVGKAEFSREDIGVPRFTVVPLPERNYPVKVQLERFIWKRKRWFTQTSTSADVTVLPWETEDGRTIDPGYIPEPGKGENSWDCGGDGVFSLSTPAKTVEDAVAATVQSVLGTRARRGAPANYGELIS